MKLKEILNGIDYTVYGNVDDLEIEGLKHDSKKVGDMFFCLKGRDSDGHDYISDAIKNGAKVIVSDRRVSVPTDIVNIVVNNTREVMALSSSNYYGNPSNEMKVIAITGTNGKTTSTYMIDSVCKSAGFKTGVIGTNGVIIDDMKIDTNMTTPDPIELQKILKIMKDRGVEIVIMEMSAHALKLQKNRGIMTDIAVFTNLTQDHLDYFKTMEEYGESKKLLFRENASKFAVLNMDDWFSKEIIKNINIPYTTVGMSGEFDFVASNINHDSVGQTFDVSHNDKDYNFKINLEGVFNVSNALGAIAVAKRLGIDYDKINDGLNNLKSVPGRFNSYNVNGRKFIVDYAHTPDGIANILCATRQILHKGNKLISIFGCGGNRDKSKRPIMGALSTELADITIVTSDNPRFEDPISIISDIVGGAHKDSIIYVEPDRQEAIKLGYKLSEPNDIIVVSGKGCENYMDKRGKKTHYEDREVIEEIRKE